MNQVLDLPGGERAFGQFRWYVIDAQAALSDSPVICVPVTSPEMAIASYGMRFGRTGAIAMLEFVPKSGPRRYYSWVDGVQ